jgi:hypothetical protein
MARAAQIAARHLAEGTEDAGFMRAKIGTARYFADHVLSGADGIAQSICGGAAGVLALSDEQF